jgi:ABC-type amino acid transport substrate-binding protein
MPLSRRSLIQSLVAIPGLAVLGGCDRTAASGSLDALRDKARAGRLTIGYIPYYEMGRFTGADTPPVGLMPDLFAIFAQAAGIPTNGWRWRSMSWDSFATVVDSGAVDLSIAGTFVTPARAAKVAFARPLFSLGNGAAARTGDARFAAIRDVMELDRPGVTIAVVSGEQSAEFAQRNFSRATILLLDGPDLGAAPQAVLARRADVAMSDQFILGRFIRAHEGLTDLLSGHPFSVFPIAWAVAQRARSVLDQINPILDHLSTSGQIAALMAKYPMIPFAR